MNDPAVVRESERYVRVIIRRPHAYRFLHETFADEGGIASATAAGCVTGDGTELPLPGLYVVDSAGTFVAATGIHGVDEVVEMLSDRSDASASGGSADLPSTEDVSIRVSGFLAAEGVT